MTAFPRHAAFSLSFVALVLAALPLSSATAPAISPTPKLQRRIDILLKRRTKLEALPPELPNPFQVNLGLGGPRDGALADNASRNSKDDDTASGSTAPAPSNVDILSSIVSRLRFGGMIVLKDQIKVVINGVQRREGDMVPAEWNNSVVYLKITKVTSTDVVLRYNDADATLKF